jgi:hypothetical protein
MHVKIRVVEMSLYELNCFYKEIIVCIFKETFEFLKLYYEIMAYFEYILSIS